MSHIGKKQIEIPEGVKSDLNKEMVLKVTGPLGALEYEVNKGIEVKIEENIITLEREDDSKKMRALHGLTRSLIFNMILGVLNGYSKELNLVGVGYTADASSNKFLLLNLGYSHPIYFEKPDSIEFETPNNTTIIVKGIDKQEVGEVSAKIRSLRKPEPYKGKGIKYSDEHIKRKAGKTVGA